MLEQDEAPEALNTIRVEDLDRQDARYFIGELVAKGLQLYGQATLIVDADQEVALANPVHVYFGQGAFLKEGEEERPFKKVRPIIGTGRPTKVAWVNGQLWEIEALTDEEIARLEEEEEGD